MKPILIFYHAFFCRGDPPEMSPQALDIVCEQMELLKQSVLEDEAAEICCGINGGGESRMFSDLLPLKAVVVYHGPKNLNENRTIQLIEERVKKLESDAHVCYFMAKGASFPPGDSFRTRWRHRMQRHIIGEWRKCVRLLESGYDACGCHWLTPESNPALIGSPYFGGNFWWANASYLKTLPPISESPAVRRYGIDAFEARYEAESFIGRGPRRPRVIDFHPGWPN